MSYTPDTAVTLCGRTLPNPVITASGTFGFGYEMAEWFDLNILGGMSLKGTTGAPRWNLDLKATAGAPVGAADATDLHLTGDLAPSGMLKPWTSSTAQRSVGPVVSDGQAPRAT